MKYSVYKLLQTAAVLVALQSSAAYAENDFYVELGQDTTTEKAAEEWKELVSKHKSLLSKLKYYPKTVMHGGVAVNTRIQAGPIDSKAKAQKICAKLFTDSIPCFVIEGNEGGPPTQVANLSETAESGGRLPWQSATPDPVQQPQVKEVTALPWLSAPAQPDKRKAQVEVAEAIRVPLTDSFDPNGNGKVTVKQLPELRPTFRKPVAENRPSGTLEGSNGWLTVDTFLNDDVALSFWQEVRSTLPKKDSNLRVRVLKPLMAKGDGRSSLNIGPFASNSEALAFCNIIQASERGLNCGFNGAQASGGNIQVASNDTRRVTRKRLQDNPYAQLSPAAGPNTASNKQYWVQVLSAGNQMDALQQWESMKSSHSDLLGGMRNSVSPSSVNKGEYVVRVGPIAGNDEAIKFCTKLQGRGINCRVLLYSMGNQG